MSARPPNTLREQTPNTPPQTRLPRDSVNGQCTVSAPLMRRSLVAANSGGVYVCVWGMLGGHDMVFLLAGVS